MLFRSGVAQSARSAVASGFNAVKIAPFDGAYYADVNKQDFKSRTKAGIERVYAIREAVGADVKIMVDCHWRLDKQAALDLMSDLKAVRISWLECPISENPDRYSDMAQLRAAANSHGMKLAGAERQIAVAGFAPFIEQQLVDVIMPDIKYAGGYAEMLRIALKCKRDGVDFSPHNPTGPICNLASMHLCMVAPAFLVLEHQLAESSLYFDVVKGYRPKLVNGCFKVPDAPGIGVELDDAVLRAHPYRALPPDANLDPRLG